MTVLITGARGAIARSLLDQLRAAEIPHKIASRTPLDGATVIDFTKPATLAAGLTGVDQIFLYAADGVSELAAAARDAGVRRLVLVSSLSVEYPDPQDHPIAAHHFAAERAVRASGLEWTVLRPGAFAANSGFWADSIKSERIARIAYPEAKLSSIHEADIADVAFAALTEDGHQGKAYALTGPESLSQRQQAELIGQAIGRPITVEALDRSVAERFLPAPVLDLFESSQDEPAAVGPCSVDITGRPSRTFGQWAADHADDFR
ncbi:MAG TPA: NAD(P)H-binding protein [Microlunatus sp.]